MKACNLISLPLMSFLSVALLLETSCGSFPGGATPWTPVSPSRGGISHSSLDIFCFWYPGRCPFTPRRPPPPPRLPPPVFPSAGFGCGARYRFECVAGGGTVGQSPPPEAPQQFGAAGFGVGLGGGGGGGGVGRPPPPEDLQQYARGGSASGAGLGRGEGDAAGEVGQPRSFGGGGVGGSEARVGLSPPPV